MAGSGAECQGSPGGGKQSVSLLGVEFRFTAALTAGCYGVEASLVSVTHGDRDR
jgi:hypothetical protein